MTARLRLTVLSAAALVCSRPVPALPAAYEFEGIGARQVSRGGAAVADVADWTAHYWNPAGLLAASDGGLRAGFEAFGGVAKSDDGDSLSRLAGPVFGKNRLESGFLLGSLGVAAPAGDGWAWGGGVYTPLLQGADFDDTNGVLALDHRAAAGILVANVSVARRLAEGLALGVGVNAVRASLFSESRLDVIPLGSRTTSRLEGDGWAPEGVLGLQWKLNARWSAGALYRTGARVVIEGDSEATATGAPKETSRFRSDFNHPATAAAGVAWRPTERLGVGVEVDYTHWRPFRGAIDFEAPGPIVGGDVPDSFDWRNTFKYRVGAAWTVRPGTDLLAGYSYDRPALDDASVDFSTTVDVPVSRYSGGVAQRLGDRWEAAAGVLFAQGRRRSGSRPVAYTLHGWQAMGEVSRRFAGN
jgi:long-chain fatty acid transport protein